MHGALYQGTSLNVYMLILTCVGMPDSSQWKQELCMSVLNEKLKALIANAQGLQNAVLTYLQQVWHTMALLMLRDDCSKL